LNGGIFVPNMSAYANKSRCLRKLLHVKAIETGYDHGV